jgi:hypothetical protein
LAQELSSCQTTSKLPRSLAPSTLLIRQQTESWCPKFHRWPNFSGRFSPGLGVGGKLERIPAFCPPARASVRPGAVTVNPCRTLCAKGNKQPMQNGIRATVDQGMRELKTKQGKDPIPPAPASGMASTSPSAFTQDAPRPEVNGATEVNAQLKFVDQVDLDAIQTTPIGSLATFAASTEPIRTIHVAIGQAIGQVAAALGQTPKFIELGTKKIYVYKDMQVVFRAGKVSDEQ